MSLKPDLGASLRAAAAAEPLVAARRSGRLGLFDVVCIGVNATVGSGVFALPDDMQRAMGGWSPLSYALCAVLLLPVALCFAELSSRFEGNGGAYVYAHRAFGDRVGFVVGWYCWANTFIAAAAVTTLLVELVGVRSHPLDKIVAVGLIAVLGAINYFGVKPGAWVVNAVTIGKLSAIFCFLGVAAFSLHGGRLGGALPLGAAGVRDGVKLAIFPLQGFEVAPVAAGETDNPRRNVPLATIFVLLFSALLFIIVQAALVCSYPSLAADSQTPLVDGARFLGPGLGLVVLVGSFVSLGGFTAGSALGAPRYAQAIAARGLLPEPLARMHPRWATPHVSIVATTALTALLAFFFDYRRLVGMSNITVVIQYLFTCLAVPALRWQKPAPGDASRAAKGWVIPGGLFVPALGALGSLMLIAGSTWSEAAFAGGTLATGIAFAWATRRQRAVR